jgi:hypothetical protein
MVSELLLLARVSVYEKLITYIVLARGYEKEIAHLFFENNILKLVIPNC